MKLNLYLRACTKINSRWIINLPIKWKTINILEEIIGKYLHNLGVGKVFPRKAQKALAAKKKTRI